MEINALESQLANIVDASSAAGPKQPKADAEAPATSGVPSDASIDQMADVVMKELEVYETFKTEGKELEYLEKNTEAMNLFFGEINLNVNFSIESTDRGYIVRVLDENGEVVKTIPSEQVVQTRQRIREMIKGIFEDKAS